MTALIAQLKPDEIAVEELFFSKTSPQVSPWPTDGV